MFFFLYSRLRRTREKAHRRNEQFALLVNNFTFTELYGGNDGIQLRFYVERTLGMYMYGDGKKYPGNSWRGPEKRIKAHGSDGKPYSIEILAYRASRNARAMENCPFVRCNRGVHRVSFPFRFSAFTARAIRLNCAASDITNAVKSPNASLFQWAFNNRRHLIAIILARNALVPTKKYTQFCENTCSKKYFDINTVFLSLLRRGKDYIFNWYFVKIFLYFKDKSFWKQNLYF